VRVHIEGNVYNIPFSLSYILLSRRILTKSRYDEILIGKSLVLSYR